MAGGCFLVVLFGCKTTPGRLGNHHLCPPSRRFPYKRRVFNGGGAVGRLSPDSRLRDRHWILSVPFITPDTGDYTSTGAVVRTAVYRGPGQFPPRCLSPRGRF